MACIGIRNKNTKVIVFGIIEKNSSNQSKKFANFLGQNLYHGNEQENQGYENVPNDVQPTQNQGTFPFGIIFKKSSNQFLIFRAKCWTK